MAAKAATDAVRLLVFFLKGSSSTSLSASVTSEVVLSSSEFEFELLFPTFRPADFFLLLRPRVGPLALSVGRYRIYAVSKVSLDHYKVKP